MHTPPDDHHIADKRRTSRALPPRLSMVASSADEERLKKQEREQRDARIRGVTSIDQMRAAIERVSCDLPPLTSVPRMKRLDADSFRTHAQKGLPFVIEGIVNQWPLCTMTPQTLREHFGHLPVRARVGDYINTAFAPDRAMQDMSLLEYLALAEEYSECPQDGMQQSLQNSTQKLPPYLGNLELRQLNRFCHWPGYFNKMGPARFWIGPAGTVTPLHCDYDDNIFAQIWGRKRIFLSPPHHAQFLYPREANAMLFGSPFNPEAPDFNQYPLARQATLIECIMQPGELLYVPAGWYHQVRSLSFSLSSNRWARALPLALHDEEALKA